MKTARQPRPDAIAMLAALNEPQAVAESSRALKQPEAIAQSKRALMQTKTALNQMPIPSAAPAIAADAPASRTKPLARPRQPKTGARAGTRLIGGHFPETTLKALKHLMAEEDCTLQALLDEAIHDLLVKKGMSKLLGA